MRISDWQKLGEAKKKGLTTEQFEKIEDLEAAIAHHQNMIDEYEKEINNPTTGTNNNTQERK